MLSVKEISLYKLLNNYTRLVILKSNVHGDLGSSQIVGDIVVRHKF